MTPAQSHFAGPRRPVEELYDTEKDPLNLTNLASSSKHQKILEKMRNEHLRNALAIRDWGFIPEYEAWKMSDGSSGWEVGKSGNVEWNKIIHTADLVGRAKESEFIDNLKSKNQVIRYWSTIGLGALEKPLSEDSFSLLK